jgi:hypothetical protein
MGVEGNRANDAAPFQDQNVSVLERIVGLTGLNLYVKKHPGTSAFKPLLKDNK